MKRIILALLILIISGTSVFAETKPATYTQPVSPIQPQAISFEFCNRIFKMDNKKLFYLTLASINANRFLIDEIQTKSGYVIFTANKQQFLASIINIDSKNSLLKVTPCDNNYYFPSGIVQNIYKYIELNLGTN